MNKNYFDYEFEANDQRDNVPFFLTLSYRTKSSAITAAWWLVSAGIIVEVNPAATAPVE